MAKDSNRRFVLLKDGNPVGVYDSPQEAMDAAEDLRKKNGEGWMSEDLYPPSFVFLNSTWKIVGVNCKGKL